MAEPLWFFISRRWYTGDYPAYPDISELPGTKILEDNFEAIRDEVLAFYGANKDTMKENFIPYSYTDPGWKTHALYSMCMRYPKRCADLPVLDSIVSQIPGMTTAVVSILEPQTRIHAHYGASNAFIRTHLGIKVPAGLPDVGIRVRREERGWEEGKTFAIEMAHRHFAWNYTDEYRIVLTLDTIKPQYADRKREISGRALATLGMQFMATKYPVLKKLPLPVVMTLQRIFGLGFQTMMLAQRITGISLPNAPKGAPVKRDKLVGDEGAAPTPAGDVAATG
jgi:hypothetical protein